MKKSFMSIQTNIIIFLIFIPMIIFILYTYYDKHKSYDFHIKSYEKKMAKVLLQKDLFIEERLQSAPLLLHQNKQEIKESFVHKHPQGVEQILLEVSMDSLEHDAMGIYSLEREEIVFHMGREDVYKDLNAKYIDKLFQKGSSQPFYIKYNRHSLYVQPIIQEQHLKGFIYTFHYHDNNPTNPYLLLLMFLFSIGLAGIAAKWMIDRTARRIQQLKHELDTLKSTGELLPVRDDRFGEIAQSVNDLKERLSSEQEFLQMMIDSLPLGILFYDQNGQVECVNRTAVQITGFSKEDIAKFTNVSGNILNSTKHVFWETLRSGETFLGFESYCPTKEGEEVPVITSTKPLYDLSGNLVGIISSFLDISEQDRLRKVEQHAKVMLDHISDGVIKVDNQGVINGFNRGAEEMTGLKAADVLGKEYDDIFIKRKTIFTKLTRTLYTGEEYTDYKKELTTDDGRKMFLMITTKILREEQDKQIGAMGIYKDITHMEELSQQIQRTDKLSVIGELAAGTAHEIRNPLTTIKGFIQLIRSELKDQYKQQYIDLILGEINHINEIIREMLLLAKPAYPHKAFVSINKMIKEIASFMKSEGALYNVICEIDLEEKLPPIEVDERQIKQVFINLIRNAIQSMKQGGKIHISSKLDEKNRLIEVAFIDQGEGIPEEQLTKIYEPFYTTKDDGTGLGIPVSYRIMKNHGGDLQIHSILGKGTTATLYFPIEDKTSIKRVK